MQDKKLTVWFINLFIVIGLLVSFVPHLCFSEDCSSHQSSIQKSHACCHQEAKVSAPNNHLTQACCTENSGVFLNREITLSKTETVSIINWIGLSGQSGLIASIDTPRTLVGLSVQKIPPIDLLSTYQILRI